MTHSPPHDETNPDESDPGSEPGDLTKRMSPPWQADFYQRSIEYVSFGDPNVNQDHVTQIPPPGCRARRTGAGWSWRCSSGAGWPPGHGRGERPHQHHRDHPDRLELAGVEVDVAPRSGGESHSAARPRRWRDSAQAGPWLRYQRVHSDHGTIPRSGRGFSSSIARYSSKCPSGSRR
ncbi:MAG: LodA/GoxA family CTQ-dependent oxidase [Solirubrobacterales bacterium]|nr:LodA/GoxA family CTQ-dependent oxidase [Solirubrobacterales bacterium]